MKAFSSSVSSIAAVQIGTSGCMPRICSIPGGAQISADQPDVLGAALLQAVDRRHRGVAGGQHRSDHDRPAVRRDRSAP